MKLIQRIKKFILRLIRKYSATHQRVSQLDSQQPSTLIPTISPHWKSGLVLVCSQCAKERSQNQFSRTASEDLRGWLKFRLKSDRFANEVRVVTTSCLGVCPKGRIAVVVGSDAGGGKGQCLSVDPKGDREVLYSHIKQKIGEEAKGEYCSSPVI